MDAKESGCQIRKYHKPAHLTISPLTGQIDFASSTLKHYECGYNSPSLPILIRIRNALNLGLDMLLYNKLYGVRDIALTGRTPSLQLSPEQIRVISDLTDVARKRMDKFTNSK